MSEAMTVDEVRVWVAEIARVQHDAEKAHSMEDSLRDAVLGAIADGAANPVELAAAALETGHFAFPRWCA